MRHEARLLILDFGFWIGDEDKGAILDFGLAILDVGEEEFF